MSASLLVESDSIDAQRAQARFAGGAQVNAAAVGDPAPSGPGQAALGGDDDPRSIAAPRGERARDQALVVAGLLVVPAIRVGGVDKRDAGIERRVQHRDTAIPAAVG